MAGGYARFWGKPGVAFVISGLGLTNTLSAMAQARADSVPILVVSGVNTLPSLGKGMSRLHELPDQQALAATVALIKPGDKHLTKLETKCAQFCLPEQMVTIDESMPIIFVNWNSHGFQAIETSMRAVGMASWRPPLCLHVVMLG